MTIAPLPAALLEAAAIPPASEPAAGATPGDGGDFLDLLSLILATEDRPAAQEPDEADKETEPEHAAAPAAIQTLPPPPPPPVVPQWRVSAASDAEGIRLPPPASAEAAPPETAQQRTADVTVAFTARLSDASAPAAAPAAPEASATRTAGPQAAPAVTAAAPPTEEDARRIELDARRPAPSPVRSRRVQSSTAADSPGEAAGARAEVAITQTERVRTPDGAGAADSMKPEHVNRPSRAAQINATPEPEAGTASPPPRMAAAAQGRACESDTAQEPSRQPDGAPRVTPAAQPESRPPYERTESQTRRTLGNGKAGQTEDAPAPRRVIAAERPEPREPGEQHEPAMRPEFATQTQRAVQPAAPAGHHAGPFMAQQVQRTDAVLPQNAAPRPAMPAAALEPPAPPEPAQAPVREAREVSIVVPASREGNGGPRVELRVAERAGEVHVAVRTPDPQVRNALRSELPALVDRLEQSGYRTEISSPHSERHAADQTHVRRAEAPADAAGRDNVSWNFDEGKGERRGPAPQRHHPAVNRPKSGQRSLFHEFFR